MTRNHYILGAIALAVVGLALFGAARLVFPDRVGGGTTYGESNLVGDVYQGLTKVKMFAEGVFVGPIDTDDEVVVDGFTQGGGIGTLTDANGGTYTLTEDELLASNYLKFAAGGAGQAVIALTLPATSTLDSLIPSAGDCREWIYDATALAAATTTTITAGTGMDLFAYTTNDDVIDGAEMAELRMCRQADTDVSVFTTEMLHAD